MLKKIWQLIFYSFLVSAAAIIQFTLIFALPSFFSAMNLVLIVLVFTLFFYDFRSALGATLIAGFWLDLFSFNFFGFYILILFLTILLANWALSSWLTNRSLYSFLALILIATISYNLISGIFSYFGIFNSSLLFLFSGFWLTLAYQCAWSLLAALLMFNLAGAATKRLKPFFLEKK